METRKNAHPKKPGVKIPDGDLLPVAVRCYLEKIPKRGPKVKGGKAPPRRSTRPHRMLVIDTETLTQGTLDNPDKMPGFNPDEWLPHAQPLLFGVAHLWTRKRNSRKWERESEWTFYPDDLPKETLVKIRGHFNRDNLRVGDWREPKNSPGVKAYFIPLSEFLTIFYREAVATRCLIVGYNTAFDLSRLACRVGPARSSFYRGGFSFVLWADPSGKHKSSLYHPRLYVKQLGQRSTTMKFSVVKLGPDSKHKYWRPYCELLDLSQLCTALLGEPLTLDGAAEALGLAVRKTKISGHGVVTANYFRYCRQDVLVSAQVAFAAFERFDKHPVSRAHQPPGNLSECGVYSGASIAKAYLRLMGAKPRMDLQPNLPRKALVAAMESYLGGRTECWMWNLPTPVAPCDFVSMYPTVGGLQALWKLIIAETIKVKKCTVEVRKFIKNIKPDDLYKPETWPLLNGFVRIEPKGEILPVRAKYAGSGGPWKIGDNPYYSPPQWLAIADLVAAKVRDPEINPEILEAFRLIPEGVQPDLEPVDFAGVLTIDPSKDDFFIKVVEERARIKAGLEPYNQTPPVELEAMSTALKIMANAGSYGIYAQVNKTDLAANATQNLNVFTSDDPNKPQLKNTPYPEHGGPFFFPPLASLITAGARLFLSMLQTAAENLGASYVLCDTDSMFLTYQAKGGFIEVPGSDFPIRLLNDAELTRIINHFNPLNLYDKDVIPHLLKHEYIEHQPLLALSLGPKRYALYDTAGNAIAFSESALGAILPPTDDSEWLKAWWEAIGSGDPLPFGNGPLIRKHSVGTWETYNHFREMNEGRPYKEQLKPFNFSLKAQADTFMTNEDPGPLIGPYNQDPASWENQPWFKTHTGEETRITLDPVKAATASSNSTHIQTIGDYFRRYKSFRPVEFILPPNNQPGLLRLRPVQRESLTLIGKESNPFAELVEVGLVDDEPQVFLEPIQVPDSSKIANGSDGSKPKSKPKPIGPGDERNKSAGWMDKLASILGDLPRTRRAKLCEQCGVTERTVRRWADLSRSPDNRLKRLIEEACINFAKEILEDSGLPIPDHKNNVIAVYKSAVPAIRIDAGTALELFVDRFGQRATASAFNIDLRTIGSWITHPERIPIEKAVLINKKGVGSCS